MIPTAFPSGWQAMPRIVIGDGALYYERKGRGFPVLFISGLSGLPRSGRTRSPPSPEIPMSSPTITAASARAM